MDTDNNKWLNALAGKENTPSDDKEINMAYIIGKRLRETLQKKEADEDGLQKLLQRLEDESLLSTKKRTRIFPYWQYAAAAALVMAVSIPVINLQNTTPGYDYPVMRGFVDAQKITTNKPEKRAKILKARLQTMGYKPQIFQQNSNLILVFKVAEITPEIQKFYSDNKIKLTKSGVQQIELSEK